MPSYAQSTTAPEMDGLAGIAVDLMDRLGAPGAGLLIALENLFPPLPSEIILPLAGFAASQGSFSIYSALFWTTLGSVVGALILYQIGAMFGRERVRRLISRIPLLDIDDVDKTEAWFARHGTKAIFFGRMLPVFRSLISIPAGVNKMPIVEFLALTTLGSLVWNSVFVLSGYWLGQHWDRTEPYADAFQKLVLAAVAIVVCWFVVTRLRRNAARSTIST